MRDSTNVIQREFDVLAGQYESNRLAEWYKAHSELVAAHSPPVVNGAVLDIGCGTGYLLRLLARKIPGTRMVGLDVSPLMIEEARRRVASLRADDFTFVNDNWEDLGADTRELLREHDIRLIVCTNAFHYFEDPQQAARNMFDALGDDGILLVLERDKAGSFLTTVWGLLHRYLIKDQVEFYDTTQLAEMLKEAGFGEVRVVSKIKKYFWKGKLVTSIALIEGHKKR